MKKLALFSLLALTLSVAQARPPVEGDVLDNNNFVLGANISIDEMLRANSLSSTPYLYGKIDGQFITYPTFAKSEKHNSSQIDVNLNLNARYGILDYFEIYGNANGYYQNSSIDADSPMYNKTNIVNFSNANIGVMATLYKSNTFHLVIGDNSDIISNMMLGESGSHMKYFGGHTFFVNFINQLTKEDAFVSSTTQIYYRLNLESKYNIDGIQNRFKNGDEIGIRSFWQIGKDNLLVHIATTLAYRASDRIDGNKPDNLIFSRHDYGGFGVGVSTGYKKDINKHLGFKFVGDVMSYSIDYNSFVASASFGLYFK